MSPALSPPAVHPTLPFAAPDRPATVEARPVDRDTPHGWTTHVVRPGDTLFDLALRGGVSVDALAGRNGLAGDAPLHPGQRLLVPRAAAPVAEAPAAPAASTPGTGGATRDLGHVVRPGETLGDIASRHGVSTGALLRANAGLDPDRVLPGRRLVVPEGRDVARERTTRARSTAAGVGSRVVTVREGDTLSGLGARHGVSWVSIVKANGLSPDRPLRAGQRLRIVGVAGSAAAHPRGGDTRLERAAAANRAHLRRLDVPSRTGVRDLVREAARRHGVDPALALAVAHQESGWNQRAVSDENAIGAMQCLPSTGRWMSEQLGRPLDLFNARDNATCGVALLRSLLRSAETHEEAIAGYYQGLASVREHGVYDDTRAYVDAVLALRARM